jgi:hypothetical protein
MNPPITLENRAFYKIEPIESKYNEPVPPGYRPCFKGLAICS